MSDINKLARDSFVGADLEDAQEAAQYGEALTREYNRYLRVRGLQPLEKVNPEVYQEDISQQITEGLAKVRTDPDAEGYAQRVIYLLTQPGPDEFHKQMYEEMDAENKADPEEYAGKVIDALHGKVDDDS